MKDLYAHSVPGKPLTDWEKLGDHLAEVASLASSFASTFGGSGLAHAAALLHDVGKASAAFQAYLHAGAGQGPDHSTAGACEAVRAYAGQPGRVLAYVIAGHHAGLADFADLERRLHKQIEPYTGWQDHVGRLPSLAELARHGRPAARASLGSARRS